MTDKIGKMCERLYEWEQQHFEDIERGIKEIQADTNITNDELKAVAENLEGDTPFRRLVRETIDYIVNKE